MGEIVVDMPASLPSLPSSDTTLDVPAPFRLWFSTGAPHAGIVLALSPVAMFVTIFLMVFIVETTDFIASIAFFLLAIFAVFVIALLSIASLVGRRTRNKGVREATIRYGPRLQSAKDWYLRGDITEGEFDQIRSLLEPATSDRSPSLAAETTATTLRSFALMFSIAAGILVPFNTVVIAEALDAIDATGLVIVLALAAIDAAAIFLVVIAWRAARTSSQVAKALAAQTTKRIDSHESEILRAARARRVGASGGAASYGSGPSFRAYGGR